MVVVAKKAARLEKRNKNIWIGSWDGPIFHQALSRSYSSSKEASKSGVNLYLVGDFGPRKDDIGW